MFLSSDEKVKELCVKKDYGLDYQLRTLFMRWRWLSWPWTRRRSSVYRNVACYSARVWKPAVHGTYALPARTSDYAEVIARSAYTVSYTQTILPPSRVWPFFRAQLVHWIQPVSLPQSTMGDAQRAPYPHFHEWAFASKISALYTWPSNDLSCWHSISHRSFAGR